MPHFAWASAEVGIIENEMIPNDAEGETYILGEHFSKGGVKAIIEFCWEITGW
jgi:hypothetical protein